VSWEGCAVPLRLGLAAWLVVGLALAACVSAKPAAERAGPPSRAGKPDVAPPAPPRSDKGDKPQTVAALRERVTHTARRYLGAPYAWGGTSPAGFDCSGFVMYVYAKVGLSLPHNAAAQYAYGTPVKRDQLKPGDLVFFDDLRHNGIYIGNGRFVHSRQSGKYVSISLLDGHWYAEQYVGARRLLTAPPVASDGPARVSTSR
jgi:cell wall-associated NlpC family hydrolase